MANPRQIELLIQASQVGADVTYMPLLVDRSIFGANNLDGQRAELFGAGANAAQPDGRDLRWYINSDQTSELASDLVSFSLDSAAGSNVAANDQGNMQAWIGGSGHLISSVTDTPVFLEYGDSALTEYASGDPYGRNNVYDANYVGVYHMEGDPSGTAPQIIDSSGNGNHGITSGGMTGSDLVASKIGNGLDFDGVDDAISLGDIDVSNSITASAWVKPTLGSAAIILNKNFDGAFVPYSLAIGGQNAALDGFAFYSGTWNKSGATSDLRGTSTYKYVNGSYDGAVIRYFVDNVLDSSTAYSGSRPTNNSTTYIASYLNDSDFYSGEIDETRISNTARSAGWISVEYNNQNSPSTFWSVNLPNAIGVAPPVTLLQMTIGINKMNGGFA